MLGVQLDESFEGFAVVHVTHLHPQGPVENLRDGPRDGVEDNHEKLGYVDSLGTDQQAVAGAYRLRCDLTKDDDQGRGDDEANDAGRKIRHEDGEERVGDCVADEEGAEKQVSSFTYGEDCLRIGLFLGGTHIGDNLAKGRKRKRPAVGEVAVYPSLGVT